MDSSSSNQLKKPWSIRRRDVLRQLTVHESVRGFLLFVGGVLPLLGYTMKDFAPLEATIALLILLVVVGGVSFLPHAGPGEYEKKAAVNWIYHETLRLSERSIDIVTGDMDWLKEDDPRDIRGLLRSKQHLDVRVVCKQPRRDATIRKGIAVLLSIGAKVRVRPAELVSLDTTGILVDSRELSPRALRVRSPKELTGEPEESTADTRWAKVDVPGHDDETFYLWKEFIEAHWGRCSQGVLLARWNADVESTIKDALEKVDLYGKGVRPTIQEVRVAELKSWCLIEDKFRLTEPVVAQFEDQGIGFFDTCFAWSDHSARIWIPPIVEEHPEGQVVMEGTHRLWHVFRRSPKATARVVMLSGHLPSLPGVPTPLPHLAQFPEALGEERRPAVFGPGYTRELYRRFNPMNEYLRERGAKLVANGHALELVSAVT